MTYHNKPIRMANKANRATCHCGRDEASIWLHQKQGSAKNEISTMMGVS